MRNPTTSRAEIIRDLLGWYDANARDLPWRVGPAARAAGQRPDPYRVWLSEVMLQQTTVAAVRDYFLRFTRLWPTVGALAAAPEARVLGEWAGLGYYARARNLVKCARIVARDLGGRFPDTREGLIALPGIGPYTAAAIAAIAFDRAEAVVDGNVERVLARLWAIDTPLPAAKPALRARAQELTQEPTLRRRPGDFAQAMMDLGATICTAKSPACGVCPLRRYCRARAAGIAPDLPRRAARHSRPVRHGIVWIACTGDGALWLERRPGKGLLGGMLGWPGSAWRESEPDDTPPFPADWQTLPGEVRHVFTHFRLILTVRHAELPAGVRLPGGFLVPADSFRPSDLPSVMRKAYELWRGR